VEQRHLFAPEHVWLLDTRYSNPSASGGGGSMSAGTGSMSAGTGSSCGKKTVTTTTATTTSTYH
jgi:hypothetical protein